MKTYAMICNNKIIEVLHNQTDEPFFPPDPVGNPVEAVECPDDATRNWIYNPTTGEISKPEPPVFIDPVEPKPTQLDRIEKTLEMLTAESMTVESVETAILEGVNEV